MRACCGPRTAWSSGWDEGRRGDEGREGREGSAAAGAVRCAFAATLTAVSFFLNS